MRPRKFGQQGRCSSCLFIGNLAEYDVYVCGFDVILSPALRDVNWNPSSLEKAEAHKMAAPYLAEKGKLYRAMLAIKR